MALSWRWCFLFVCLFFPALIFPFPHSFWLWHHESDLTCFPDLLWVSDLETQDVHMKIQMLLKRSLGKSHGKALN